MAAAWQFVEDEHKQFPNMDVYGALHQTTKLAVEAVTITLVQQLGPRLGEFAWAIRPPVISSDCKPAHRQGSRWSIWR